MHAAACTDTHAQTSKYNFEFLALTTPHFLPALLTFDCSLLQLLILRRRWIVYYSIEYVPNWEDLSYRHE